MHRRHPKRSRSKYEFDHERDVIKLDRFLPSSVVYKQLEKQVRRGRGLALSRGHDQGDRGRSRALSRRPPALEVHTDFFVDQRGLRSLGDPILDSAADAVIGLDEHGRAVVLNVLSKRFLDIDRSEARGRAVAENIYPKLGVADKASQSPRPCASA